VDKLELGGDLAVGRLGLGTLRIMNAGAERGSAVLRRAVELGVNLIDTADVYAGGEIELLIAETLHPYPEDLVIATKGGQVIVGQEPRADCRPEHLRAACEASLRRLRLDRIDLYQLHNPDPHVPLEEALGALVELRAEGKIGHLGVSNLHTGALEPALANAPIVSLQNPYSVNARRSEAELDLCERAGLVFLAYFPLDGGSLVHADGPVRRVAESRGATVAQIALAWILQRSPVALPIPCTTAVEHLEENMRAGALRLSNEELYLLEAGGPAHVA
jgi:aryl-alcohol dehydrogenase-like predicted oxidoreductase